MIRVACFVKHRLTGRIERDRNYQVKIGPTGNPDVALIPPLGDRQREQIAEFIGWANEQEIPVVHYRRDRLPPVRYAFPVSSRNGRQIHPWLKAIVDASKKRRAIAGTSAAISGVPMKRRAKRGRNGYPDVIVTGVNLSEGQGGAEKSIRSFVRGLDLWGYHVLLKEIRDISRDVSRGTAHPKCVIFQSNCARQISSRLPRVLKDTLKVQYIQDVRFADGHWKHWDLCLCNSQYILDWALENGAPRRKVVIQEPNVDAQAARVEPEKRDPQWIVTTHMGEHKGGDLFREVAAVLMQYQFVGLTRGNKVKKQSNFRTKRWVVDMRTIYRKARVVVVASEVKESFCRTVAEAAGNGIPCVVSTAGNLPHFAERWPDLVTIVKGRKVDDWALAVQRAAEKGLQEPQEDAWAFTVEPTVKALEALDVSQTPGRQVIQVQQAAGYGDALMALPTIRELAKTKEVYIAGGCHPNAASVFRRSPWVTKGKSPTDARTVTLQHFNPADRIDVIRSESRPRSIARRANVRPPHYQPMINLTHKEVEQAIAALPPRNGRPFISVGFNASTKERQMPDPCQRNLIFALAEKYEVMVMHKTQTVGRTGEFEHVYDLGGTYTEELMPALVANMDLMIAVDCGLAHIAATVFTPSIIIVGAVGLDQHIRYDEYASAWRPGLMKVLCRGLDCQPCWGGNNRGGIDYKCGGPPKCLEWGPKEILPIVERMLR